MRNCVFLSCITYFDDYKNLLDLLSTNLLVVNLLECKELIKININI